MADLVSTALARDQAKAAAGSTARSLAELQRRKAAALDCRRQALESALVQRDQLLEEVRRAKDANDPLPDAFRLFLERVR